MEKEEEEEEKKVKRAATHLNMHTNKESRRIAEKSRRVRKI